MSRLTWDGTAELVSRDQILRRGRELENIQFIFPVQLTTRRIGNLARLILCDHTYIYIFICVCVLCVFSSHPFWTSRSLDVPAGVTQEEGHTGFLFHLPSAVRALIFVARRIQPFLSLVDREVEFCVLTN